MARWHAGRVWNFWTVASLPPQPGQWAGCTGGAAGGLAGSASTETGVAPPIPAPTRMQQGSTADRPHHSLPRAPNRACLSLPLYSSPPHSHPGAAGCCSLPTSPAAGCPGDHLSLPSPNHPPAEGVPNRLRYRDGSCLAGQASLPEGVGCVADMGPAAVSERPWAPSTCQLLWRALRAVLARQYLRHTYSTYRSLPQPWRPHKQTFWLSRAGNGQLCRV